MSPTLCDFSRTQIVDKFRLALTLTEMSCTAVDVWMLGKMTKFLVEKTTLSQV